MFGKRRKIELERKKKFVEAEDLMNAVGEGLEVLKGYKPKLDDETITDEELAVFGAIMTEVNGNQDRLHKLLKELE